MVRRLWLGCPLHSRTRNQAPMGRDQAEGLARGTEGLWRAPPQSKSNEEAYGPHHLRDAMVANESTVSVLFELNIPPQCTCGLQPTDSKPGARQHSPPDLLLSPVAELNRLWP